MTRFSFGVFSPCFGARCIAWVCLLSFALTPANAWARGAGGVPANVNQLLTVRPRVTSQTVSKSMWGNLLLSLAYLNDPVLARLNRKQGNLDRFVFTNVAVIGGLDMVQSTTTIATGTSNMPSRRILGLVGSSMTVGGILIQGALGRRYRKQIEARKQQIAEQAVNILERMEKGEDDQLIRLELDNLIGELASAEFLEHWHSTHITLPKPAMPNGIETWTTPLPTPLSPLSPPAGLGY